jgi:hypothetical protein
MDNTVPKGWVELRLPPEPDLVAVEDYIKGNKKGMKFKFISPGVDRWFVVSENKLDEHAIVNVAKGLPASPTTDDDARTEAPPPGLKRQQTLMQRIMSIGRTFSWK